MVRAPRHRALGSVAIEAGPDAERGVVLRVRGKPRRSAVSKGEDEDEGGEPREGDEEKDLDAAHRRHSIRASSR